MSKAADEGKKLAQNLIAERAKATETILNDPLCRQSTLGEATISLMEDGVPVNKETLRGWIEKRIPISSPGFDRMKWERLLEWLKSLPAPKTSLS